MEDWKERSHPWSSLLGNLKPFVTIINSVPAHRMSLDLLTTVHLWSTFVIAGEAWNISTQKISRIPYRLKTRNFTFVWRQHLNFWLSQMFHSKQFQSIFIVENCMDVLINHWTIGLRMLVQWITKATSPSGKPLKPRPTASYFTKKHVVLLPLALQFSSRWRIVWGKPMSIHTIWNAA